MRLTEKQVDDLIDLWHNDRSIFKDATLHEFLGWTWPDYAEWVQTGDIPDGQTPMPWR